MLYNVYINHGVAIKVTEYNAHCTPCNNMDSVVSEEKRVMKINIPQGIGYNPRDFESIKNYLNLNNIL